jgi:hypothetical protein
MTDATWDFMTSDRQIFLRSVAEAAASLLERKYPTAKHLARACQIDPATAENLRKGSLSVRTLEKIAVTEGRGFWERLGDEIFGESFADYEERRLQAIINEAENARQNIRSLAARRAALESRALGAVDALGGPPADGDRDLDRLAWREADQQGHRSPRRKSSARKA